MHNDKPIISVKPDFDQASGTWKVEITLSGLYTEAQALYVADYITAAFCGPQIPEVRN